MADDTLGQNPPIESKRRQQPASAPSAPLLADTNVEQPTGVIGWFATNHVATTLLMVTILLGGVYAAIGIKKEMMPKMETGVAQVTVQFRGGTPEDVEEGVVVKIEEVVRTLEGVKEVRSTAAEDQGSVRIETVEGTDMKQFVTEVQAAVDTISTFSTLAERPIVREYSPFFAQAVNVQVSADIDEVALNKLAEQLQDELLALPEITYVELMGVRPYEIGIEISETKLRQHSLTMNDVANVVRQWSVSMSGGFIDTDGGNIRVRAKGQAYTGVEFEQIELLIREDGTRLYLGDVATIKDGFVDSPYQAYFNGKRTIGLQPMARDDESIIEVANVAKAWVEERRQTLPESVDLSYWGDATYYLTARLSMMIKNLGFGALLVFIMLGLFLRLKVAAWVVVGLPIAFLGALATMPYVGTSVNIASLFGFILVIGIVVDDAIIIAESASAETESKGYTVTNIVKGAQRVAVPATFGVLTTVAAFSPMILMGGPMAPMNGAIGWVVVLCLLFSLVESKLILPSHMALMKSSGGFGERFSDFIDRHLKRFINGIYQPLLRKAIEWRYATLAIFFSMLILVIGMLMGGQLRVSFFPEFENDFVRVNVSLLDGSPEALLETAVDQIEATLWEINDEIAEQYPEDGPPVRNIFVFTQENSAQFSIELARSDNRALKPSEIAYMWQHRVGDVAGLDEFSFSASQGFGGRYPISLSLRGPDYDNLRNAADELVDYLRTFDGLYEVSHQAQEGPNELKLAVKPEGAAAGLTLQNLARQVRESFYGLEVQRIQRGKSDVRVMLRFPEEERKSLGNLESMWVQLPNGETAPFNSVATYSIEQGVSSIMRIDGYRNIEVRARANNQIVNTGAVLNQTLTVFFPQLQQRYPGVTWAFTGASQQEVVAAEGMYFGFAGALILIYALMAIPLKSYLQPLIIMSVIPFGLIGAMLGHWILGMTVNMVSMIGCIALTGVVVNDALILVHYANRKLADGSDLVTALMRSGKARFRAILLTSVTTFFGLVPILLETSLHAKIIHQMAVSIAFGIVFATLITLILVPTELRIMVDIGWNRKKLRKSQDKAITPPFEPAPVIAD